MEKISVLIVDDEFGNRENVRRMMEKFFPHLILLPDCASVQEAQEVIGQQSPDIILLDICLGDKTGFNLLESLGNASPEVIFITAYDQYAIKAIRFSALDYLLKPIDPQELVSAVNKAINIIIGKQQNLRMQNLLQNNIRPDRKKKIALAVVDRIEFVEINNIIRCESDSNYTTFYLKNGEKLIVSKTLKEFDELLTPYNFLRIHQSHLINMEEVKSFVKTEGGYIRMNDGAIISISRQRRAQVMEALKYLT
ncbi:LytTR family DNA-binding domain-containing protein [Bacteroides sp. 519]|uniref:LytR/AlgR family response regulator transcription factor n=1 Tax=Bacteroides sp. 519 TaxID=2302937 RepID=UPI0013D6D4CE|nr:LytTR family DNA-binding domain-containing protein [Bacteroides sp. 519]NDV59380.1 DNA-binding response regulator [Bacteroides sp. 519]